MVAGRFTGRGGGDDQGSGTGGLRSVGGPSDLQTTMEGITRIGTGARAAWLRYSGFPSASDVYSTYWLTKANLPWNTLAISVRDWHEPLSLADLSRVSVLVESSQAGGNRTPGSNSNVPAIS
jgi:hypothetical protein